MISNLICGACGENLPTPWAHESKKYPCPKCGGFIQKIHMEVADEVDLEIHDKIEVKLKDPKFSSKHNPRVEVVSGDDLRHSDGKWMIKERVIDKDGNYYKEKVIDPKTGQVVHLDEGPLSEHVDHGSAKFKKGNDA